VRVCPGKRASDRPLRIAKPCQRFLAGELQAIRGSGLEFSGAPIQVSGYFLGEISFIGGHSVTPLAFSMIDSAWTAREQCVFTLPSEQPIAAAASATSNSSQ
jgi:hypothetical protein